MKNSALLFYIILITLFSSCGSNSEKVKIDINDTKALTEYLQGKWEHNVRSGSVNETRRYRIEIKGDKLKIWNCISNLDDPFNMKDGYDEFNFELAQPSRDIDGYESRYLIIDEFNNELISLRLRELEPIWLVSDKNWDTPVIRSGGGLPTWNRVNFESAGQKIQHDNHFSNLGNDNRDNSFSTSNNDAEHIESSSTNSTINEDNTNTVYLTVMSDKAYFFEEEDNISSKTGKFLVKGDVAEFYEEGNGYIRVRFKNKDGKETLGWILKSDFSQSSSSSARD